ncbi:MAG TPA: thiamine pyrophosphate-dependent enzyme [Bauldia sp.]|nr:thiamine pyrophosphate-dependent enzyme [Bauldia sp.]
MSSNQGVAGMIGGQERDFARRMLAEIAFVRAFETKAWALTQTNPPRVPGSMHFCAGQEVVPLAGVAGLRDDDQIIATYRGHGWALASGLDPRAVMGEICQKACGVNGGRAGSAYMMAPDTRFIGENSIVGAGTTAACGVALANLAAGNGRVVAVSIGDGAMNQGSVHEAMAFAAAKSLPVIFVVENNGWSELTPTDAMFRIQRLARRAGGYGIESATIDGTDPFAVRDTFAMAAEQLRAGKGPCLIECTVPRLWGHYHRDIEHYRPKADKQAHTERDPLMQLGERLVQSGIMDRGEVDAAIAAETARVEELAEEVMRSADPDPTTARGHVVALPSAPGAEPGETRVMTYVEAVNAALRAELEADPRTVVYGEDVGQAGGVFGATRYLQRDFGAARVFDTPISENAILGSAVGAAMAGLKPIVEIMWLDFMMVAFDQLVNQASNVRYVTGGKTSVPIVVRTQQGATPGACAQHSQTLEALLAHIPGLKVAVAASADDAYSLLRAAAADPDPCIVIEARGLYPEKGPVQLTRTAEPVGLARTLRQAGDVGIVTWGTMVPRVLAAAEELARAGVEAGVLNLRWLNPLDETALMDFAARSGGRILIVHEAVRTGGFAGEIALRLAELVGDRHALTVRRLTTADTRIPASPVLQNELLPSVEAIVAAAIGLTHAGTSASRPRARAAT